MWWVVNSTSRPFYPREGARYPLYRKLGGAPGPVWTGAENLAPPPGFDPRTVQPVASRYIDWAMAAHEVRGKCKVGLTAGHVGTEGEYRCISTRSLTSVLDGGWTVNPTPQPLYPRYCEVVTECYTARSWWDRFFSPSVSFHLKLN
jgi:hypothetical protein